MTRSVSEIKKISIFFLIMGILAKSKYILSAGNYPPNNRVTSRESLLRDQSAVYPPWQRKPVFLEVKSKLSFKEKQIWSFLMFPNAFFPINILFS